VFDKVLFQLKTANVVVVFVVVVVVVVVVIAQLLLPSVIVS